MRWESASSFSFTESLVSRDSRREARKERRQIHVDPNCSPSTFSLNCECFFFLVFGFSYLPQMSWYETLTSTPLLIAGTLGISAAIYSRRHTAHQVVTQVKEVTAAAGADGGTAKMAQAVNWLKIPHPPLFPNSFLSSLHLSCHLPRLISLLPRYGTFFFSKTVIPKA